MSDKIDIMEHIEKSWTDMLDERKPIMRQVKNDHDGQLRHTAYKQLEQIAVNLTEDLDALTEVLVTNFNEKFELSPGANVDLRQVLASAVSCSSQLGATATFEATQLGHFTAEADKEDYIYDAIADYNKNQEVIINKIWNGVNN